MNRMASSILIILSCVILSSCVPESIHPLSDPKTAELDNRLIGVWRFTGDESDTYFYLHFGREKYNTMKVIYIVHEEDSDVDFLTFTMSPTIIDGEHYMNLRIIDSSEDYLEGKGGYIFAKYEITRPKTMSLWVIDAEKTEDAIKKGDLQGTIGEFSVEIMDTSENIVRYILSNKSDKLFGLMGQFEKIE